MTQAQNDSVVAVLGGGSMGHAVLSGMLQPGVPGVGEVRVTTRSAASAQGLVSAHPTTGAAELLVTALEEQADANRAAVRGAETVILAVKPAMITDVLEEIAADLAPDALIISVAAGVPIARMETLVPAPVAVLRAMPNTPAFVGKAVTGLSAGGRATDAQLQRASAIFEAVGQVLVVPETQLDALSAISGSGPAYVFLLIETLAAAAVQKGFTPEQALVLVSGTFNGAADLLVASGEAPAELRRRVTSPKGTTEQAIAVLQDAGLEELFVRATDAAVARARELAAG